MRCCCTIGEAIIVDQTLVVVIGSNICIEIIILLTIAEGIFNDLCGLKYDLLLDISGLLTLVGCLFPETPSFPSASGVGAVPRLALPSDLLIEAC